jgi:uncharacterized protein
MTTSRTALITGASAGLGSEFARQLAARGYDLVLVARRRERLEALAAELASTRGVSARVLTADLSQGSAPAEIAAQLRASGTHIDFLVNNAGIAGGDLLEDRDWQQHRDFCQLMMLSVLELCHLLIPPMRERGFGRVINVASVAGRVPRVDGGLYGPSKALLVALSENLSLSLKGSGVNVCALCPGFTHTEFHSAAGLDNMKARLPGFLWYDAEVVVREGLKAVEKGKPVYLSGRLYRWVDPLMQSVFTRRLFRTPGRHPTAQ